MPLPAPSPGLVIGYAYLWRDESRRGRTEGVKDRPCVIVMSVQSEDGRAIVTVAPITHTQPRHLEFGVEVPTATKVRLGLDGQPSWIIASDLNRFVWPGVDLRPVRRGSTEFAYGLLPASLFRQVRDRVLALARARRTATTSRDE